MNTSNTEKHTSGASPRSAQGIAPILPQLTPLYKLNETTDICILPETKALYVVKEIPLDAWERYSAIAELNHPNLARIASIEQACGRLYAVREYISGRTLSEILSERETIEREEAIRIAICVLRGLEALHALGIIHRDVTPNNVILTTDGGVKLIDFDITRVYEANKTIDTDVLGTPGYAAPEQFGFTQSDSRADIYAVGVLLNVMLTGRQPTEQPVSGGIGEIVRKCTALDPVGRFRNAEAVIKALESGKDKGTVLDKIISAIPGIRSRRIPVAIASVFLYFFAIMLTQVCYSIIEGGALYRGLFWVTYLFSTVIPFACFHNLFDLREKLPFLARSKNQTKRTFLIIIGMISLLGGFYAFLCLYEAGMQAAL